MSKCTERSARHARGSSKVRRVAGSVRGKQRQLTTTELHSAGALALSDVRQSYSAVGTESWFAKAPDADDIALARWPWSPSAGCAPRECKVFTMRERVTVVVKDADRVDKWVAQLLLAYNN